MKDKLLEYLIVTDTFDEFLGNIPKCPDCKRELEIIKDTIIRYYNLNERFLEENNLKYYCNNCNKLYTKDLKYYIKL